MLQHWARVDLEVMEMKEYSAFPKAPASLLRAITTIPGVCVWGGEEAYSAVEMQSVHSTAPADWAKISYRYVNNMPQFIQVHHQKVLKK